MFLTLHLIFIRVKDDNNFFNPILLSKNLLHIVVPNIILRILFVFTLQQHLFFYVLNQDLKDVIIALPYIFYRFLSYKIITSLIEKQESTLHFHDQETCDVVEL